MGFNFMGVLSRKRIHSVRAEERARIAAEEQEQNLEDLTNDELRDMLRERGLLVSGNKKELVERLQENG